MGKINEFFAEIDVGKRFLLCENQAAHVLRELALELKGHVPRTRLRL